MVNNFNNVVKQSTLLFLQFICFKQALIRQCIIQNSGLPNVDSHKKQRFSQGYISNTIYHIWKFNYVPEFPQF